MIKRIHQREAAASAKVLRQDKLCKEEKGLFLGHSDGDRYNTGQRGKWGRSPRAL